MTIDHEGVLDFVNEVREVQGLAPIDHLRTGERRCATACVIARSCSDHRPAYATSEAITVRDANERLVGLPTPQHVHDFIVAFDAGELPQYDEAVVRELAYA